MVHKKKKIKTNSNFLKFFLVVSLAIYFCTVFIKQEVTISQLRASAKTIEEQIDQKNKEKKQLNEKMQKDNYYERVEEIARDKLGFLKENEILFVDALER